MDTELARTFLAVVAAGSFVKAAERLYVTQSTVSARIQSLEEQLGCQLFVRNKAGTVLTNAGRQFQKHATTLLRVVAQARQDVGVPRGFRASLTIGARIGIWERLISHALVQLRAVVPDVAVRAEIGFEEELMLGLVEGRLDIGVMYTPQSRPGLNVELVAREELVLVSTDPGDATGRGEPGPNYVYIDWGPEFFARHNTAFPEFTGPALSTNVGWLGLQHILAHGGAGYFPRRLIAAELAAGRLTALPGAPTFELPAYVVYPLEREASVFEPALEVIRRVAAAT
ncbi:MAG TPA: LysR family transcriptional regulator [Gammaproteobacteria bacterium]|jgi:DNA-binding transcriptional LysR family regulator|nr:LysR family transcriptional regulator [Gammaproteobacteria bacterium]